VTILSAQTIRQQKLISPFCEKTLFEGRSYGLSAAGYDVRIAQTIWLWPFWGRLASTIERFDMPVDVAAEVKDKSSNARIFVLVQNTFIDPGWRGYLTLELTRGLPWPIRIKAGTPIAQIIFKYLDEPTEIPYRGKYQDQQEGPVASIHEKSDGSSCGTNRQDSLKSRSKPIRDQKSDTVTGGEIRMTFGPRDLLQPGRYEYDEQNCPGHVVSVNPQIRSRCGIHVDSLRTEEENLG
jgi:dCTP deaminase